MHAPSLLNGFFMGGFECSTQRRADGRRLDLIDSSGHFSHAAADYATLANHGLRTLRDGVRWHLIEATPGRYDLSSFLPMLRAARAAGVQPVWDLCHYGWPDHVDIWRPAFVDAFAAFAECIARVVRDSGDEVPFYSIINEVSYWSWAGGDKSIMHPMGIGRGLELKHQLTRATIAAIQAVRNVDRRARFISIDPIIHVMPRKRGQAEKARSYLRAQYDGWLLLSGELWPGLGGHPSYLDIVGLNYYDQNQWWLGGSPISRENPNYVPFRTLLKRAHLRLKRPLLVAETGAEGEDRAPWLRYIADEVAAAMEAGVPIERICLYPIVDYPGWDDDRHCLAGLLGMPDETGRRRVDGPLAEELARQQARFQEICAARTIR